MKSKLKPAARPASGEGQAYLSAAVVRLMAITVGCAVASNYYAQPLLQAISAHFGVSATEAGGIVTVAQLSYAMGLLLLVPLGDLVGRRGLVVLMTALSAVGLLATAHAPSLPVMLLGTAMTGGLSVVAQVLLPLASALAAPDARGKAVGTVMSGLLLGILLARVFAGVLADLGDWRLVYRIAAAAMLVLSAALWRMLPRVAATGGASYPRLLASTLRLYVDEPLVRTRSLLGVMLFASFSLMWTPLTFLLSAPPYRYSSAAIGLFGLAGAAGAWSVGWFGRLVDRGRGDRATWGGLALLLASWLPLACGTVSPWALVVGIVLLDCAIQGVHVTSLGLLYRRRPDARSRLTAGAMTCNFVGAALGSQLSLRLYTWAGWPGVCMTGGVLAALALLCFAVVRNGAPASQTDHPGVVQ
jgi:predicted MFS family arabinose efflux permease